MPEVMVRFFISYGLTALTPALIVLIVLIVLTALASFLFERIKNGLKSEILSTCNTSLKLETLTSFENNSDSNMCEVITNLQKAGNVVKIQEGMTDFMIASSFLFEFVTIPSNIFNSDIPKIQLIKSSENSSTRLRRLHLSRILISSITKNINTETLRYQSALIDEYSAKLLNNHSVRFADGVYEIENIFDYTQGIIKHMSIITLYGKAVKSDRKLQSIVNYYLSSSSSFSDYNLALARRLRVIFFWFKEKLYNNYMEKYVKAQLSNRPLSLKNFKAGKKNAMQLLLENANFGHIDYRLISLVVFGVLMNHCKLLAPRISNFIVDMSLNAEAYSKLVLEQKKIIKKFGDDITLYHLDKMKFLDAFLVESARLSDAPMLIRKVTQNFNLSNGAHFPKNSYLKFQGFIYNRDPGIFGNDSLSFRPERHIASSTTLSEYSGKNLMWGLGPRMCPAREYSVVQLKLFAAMFIRKYEVLQEGCLIPKNHKGYKFRDTLLHVTSKVYIRPHDILLYKYTVPNIKKMATEPSYVFTGSLRDDRRDTTIQIV